MIHILALLLLLTSAFAQAPSQLAPQTPPKAPAAVDRNAFTFSRYDLNATITPEQRSLQIRGTVQVTNRSAQPQTAIALQISSTLSWASVRINGQPLPLRSQRISSDVDHTGELNEATVTLLSPLAPDQSLVLEVAYQGTIPLSANRLQRIGAPADVAQHSDWDVLGQTFAAFRGFGYVTWYPVALDPVALTKGNAVFRALGEFKTRNTGTLHVHFTNSPKLLHSGTTLANGDVEFPLSASIVPVIAFGNYSVQSTPFADVARLNAQSASVLYADVASTTAPFITSMLGAPREKVQLIQNADERTSSFESASTLITPMETADPKEIGFQLAHSLAHTSVHSFRPWIFEGIAHFAQVRIREQQAGRAAALAFLVERRPALAIADPDEPTSASAQSLINTSDELFYRTKAMFVWWMLRDMVGDDAFKRAISAYRPEDDKDAAYVQHLFEKESNRQLEPFFDDWVYRDRGLPDFRVVSVYPRQSMRGGFLVTVQVENLGNAGAEVPIRIHTKAGDVTTRLELRGKDKAAARVETTAAPEEVTVNDGSVPESDPSNNTFTVPITTPSLNNSNPK